MIIRNKREIEREKQLNHDQNHDLIVIININVKKSPIDIIIMYICFDLIVLNHFRINDQLKKRKLMFNS